MPKMKSHKGASKRFRKTGSGRLKRSHAFTSHLARSKSEKQKRQLRKGALVDKSDQSRIEQLVSQR
ncbi:50S ribosomal protein L35 [Texcoconibacillus texcoconensis]|uniref:Large ribosomal subunit protein bL35 n=1 Tax=Texcoconibacillus texcoconensis TaxID=1095777 RepID=A0A840QMZ1_9BACI|nr:50S ribosomal protein L35 [Texcoconibacillus texcoconensis]MBB5172700.1 large subunit ribosomal protein L35 [Texcoconibacillus texcoconensis]